MKDYLKPGDLVMIEGYKTPSIFLGWCTDTDLDAEFGTAHLLVDGEIRKEHNDWWSPWKAR